VTNPNNFIRRYIQYAAELNDSPWDYHEAIALTLLSCATQGLKLNIPKIPFGLRTNLYIMLLGDSFRMRKSVAMSRGKLLLDESMPMVALPTSFTLEGLQNALAEREDAPTAIIADEFSYHLGRMMRVQYMEGLRGFLLQMYNNESWIYRRSDKGNVKKTEDIIRINGCHLSILGNVTPDIKTDLSERDMKDGFLGRFLVISPEEKPPRSKLHEDCTEDFGSRAVMIQFLKDVVKFCSNMKRAENIAHERGRYFNAVEMSIEALMVIDAFQEEIENKRYDSHSVGVMVQRLTDYALKAAILIAVGEIDLKVASRVDVEAEHAKQAVELCNKWMGWAEKFGGEIGHSPLESKIQKAAEFVENRGLVLRSDICRLLHLTKREADDIQNTLLDRGLIVVGKIRKKNSRKSAVVWKWHSYEPREEFQPQKKYPTDGPEPPPDVGMSGAPQEVATDTPEPF
jgi:hypothetical protein